MSTSKETEVPVHMGVPSMAWFSRTSVLRHLFTFTFVHFATQSCILLQPCCVFIFCRCYLQECKFCLGVSSLPCLRHMWESKNFDVEVMYFPFVECKYRHGLLVFFIAFLKFF